MLNKVIIAYKELGETPLECLERMRIKHNVEQKIPMTYAGRLDPMAEGLLIILLGEECKKKDVYLHLNKTYEIQILFGFETDTSDLLGIVNKSKELYDDTEILLNNFRKILQSFVGTFIQKYPAFSSKTINGKQLFQLSKDGLLPDQLPDHQITITKLEYIECLNIEKNILQKEILRRINLVSGDFRQKEIIDCWVTSFVNSDQKEYMIVSCVAICSSGTYIRQLVKDISEKIGIPLVTYSIKRTKVGEYSI